MLELKEMHEVCRGQQMAQQASDQPAWRLVGLVMQDRLAGLRQDLVGQPMRLQTYAGGCWCCREPGGATWLVRDEGELHGGVCRQLLPAHRFRHTADGPEICSDQPAVVLEESDRRLWLAPLIRLNFDKCEGLSLAGEPAVRQSVLL